MTASESQGQRKVSRKEIIIKYHIWKTDYSIDGLSKKSHDKEIAKEKIASIIRTNYKQHLQRETNHS